MDGLRWLLLAVGLVVILGVYWFSRRQIASPDDAELDSGERIEPTLLDQESEAPGTEAGSPALPPAEIDPAEIDYETPVEEEGAIEEAAPPPSKSGPVEQKIVTLRVVARDRGSFRGDDLILSLRGIGMRHGKFGIFHRYEGAAEDDAIFSAASLVEPGSFDLSNIKDQAIPGISLFAVLPGPVASVEAFDLMMAAARAVAKTMEADLLDETGSTLSIQRERYMREEVIAFDQRSKLRAGNG